MDNLMSFENIQFPLSISFGATGGPEFRNEIVSMTSGFEQRNARHSMAIRRYDAGTGIRSKRDLYSVLAFFEARHGSLISFRFRDPFDNVSGIAGQSVHENDQIFGLGDGATRSFQLRKAYHAGQQMPERIIHLPVAGSVKVAIDGDLFAQWSLDALTGTITFDEPPEQGAVLSAGYQFDVPVRFDTEQLLLSVSSFEAGTIPAIPLKEVRL